MDGGGVAVAVDARVLLGVRDGGGVNDDGAVETDRDRVLHWTVARILGSIKVK